MRGEQAKEEEEEEGEEEGDGTLENTLNGEGEKEGDTGGRAEKIEPWKKGDNRDTIEGKEEPKSKAVWP